MRLRNAAVTWSSLAIAASRLVGCSVGCSAGGPRVYTAMAYDADAGCLAGYAPVGTVQAADLPATCSPICLVAPDTLWVSTICAPYPSEVTPIDAAVSDACASALAAFAAARLCGNGEGRGDGGTQAADEGDGDAEN